MASYTITIPNNVVSRVVDGIAYQNGYKDNVPDPEDPENTIPNPETKVDFAKRMNRKWIRENVRAWETKLAQNTARNTANSDADTATDAITAE